MSVIGSTVVDVYSALRRALLIGEAVQAVVWARFAQAHYRETGISPQIVRLETELLSENGVWVHVANGLALLWSAIVIVAVAVVGWVLL